MFITNAAYNFPGLRGREGTGKAWLLYHSFKRVFQIKYEIHKTQQLAGLYLAEASRLVVCLGPGGVVSAVAATDGPRVQWHVHQLVDVNHPLTGGGGVFVWRSDILGHVGMLVGGYCAD